MPPPPAMAPARDGSRPAMAPAGMAAVRAPRGPMCTSQHPAPAASAARRPTLTRPHTAPAAGMARRSHVHASRRGGSDPCVPHGPRARVRAPWLLPSRLACPPWTSRPPWLLPMRPTHPTRPKHVRPLRRRSCPYIPHVSVMLLCTLPACTYHRKTDRKVVRNCAKSTKAGAARGWVRAQAVRGGE